MASSNQKKIILIGFVLFLVACGAAVPLPEGEPSNFSATLQNAIWHPEGGGSALITNLTSGILEDGSNLTQGISISALNPSSYINGVFLMDIPDRDQVSFETNLSFLSGAQSSGVAVRLYLQDNGQFIPLSEVVSYMDGKVDHLSADLSSYRGQSRL